MLIKLYHRHIPTLGNAFASAHFSFPPQLYYTITEAAKNYTNSFTTVVFVVVELDDGGLV